MSEQGGAQVEYEDQDPRIHKMWLQEIAKHGVTSRPWASSSTKPPSARPRDEREQ